jgi:Reverse transcriptase (RNA-dependent DNA polymerase)
MAVFGFLIWLLNWIQFLVLKETSKVILNSVTERNIKLKERVCQGDSIALYLFNIVIDFLVRWIAQLGQLPLLRAPFQGCQMCLLYADDTLVFRQTCQQQIKIFKILLMIFQRILRLLMLNHENLLNSNNQ